MRVLLTGGSGFLGSAVARELVRQQIDVVATVRAQSPRQHLADMPGVEVREGSLLDQEWLAELMHGCDGLLHVAGAAGSFYANKDHYRQTNEELTRHVFRAARTAQVARAVYCGTIVIPQGLSSAYALSKKNGAEIARQEGGEQMALMVVHPAGMVGPEDRVPTPLGRGILKLANGALARCLGGGGAYVHVDDAAQMMVAALLTGENNREYVASAEYRETEELFGILAKRMGVSQPKTIPNWTAHAMSHLMEGWARITGGTPPLSRFTVSYMLQDPNSVPDGHPDRATLGLPPYRSVEEGCMEGIEWFRNQGWIEDTTP